MHKRLTDRQRVRRPLSDQTVWILMLLPAVILALLFRYAPMFGIVMAFQDFNPVKGFFGSKWVGLANFEYIFTLPTIWNVVWNTVSIAFAKIIFSVLVPLILALLLNELISKKLVKFIQTSVFMPFFLSWIILGGVMLQIFSGDGVINSLITSMGGEKINFFTDNGIYPKLLVATDTWKGMGYNMIIFTASILGIGNELYEAAALDGAGRWRQMIHVTLPGIMPMIMLLLILSMGGILNAGFEQIFVTYNPLVYESGDVLDTFVYRLGIFDKQYSAAAAVDLIKSVVGAILVGITHLIATKTTDYRIF